MQRKLRQPPYEIRNFKGKRLSDWVPSDAEQAQAPSADSTDALWALVRLWSETAGRPPRTRRYWAELAEQAREAPALTTDGQNGTAEVVALAEAGLDWLGESVFAQLVWVLVQSELDAPKPAKDSLTRLAAAEGAWIFHQPSTAGRHVHSPLFFDSSNVEADEVVSRIAQHLQGIAEKLPKDGWRPIRLTLYTNVPRPKSADLVGEVARHWRLHEGPPSEIRFLFRDGVCALLRKHPGTLQKFTLPLLPGGSLAAKVGVYPDRSLQETAALIGAATAGELVSDQWVRLGQAGDERDQQKLSLGPIAIDLEAARAVGAEPVLSARHILNRGDRVLRPSVRRGDSRLRNIALIGGPGQGKSTLGQLVSQVYRAALLGEDEEELFPAGIRAVLRGLHEDLAAAGVPRPQVQRWPIRVALHDFANHLAVSGRPGFPSGFPNDGHAPGGTLSLLHYLRHQAGRRMARPLSAERFEQWLATWPWFLVLDGLDEVASPETREAVMTAIEEFLLYVRQLDADHLILATTRPQGYRGEFHVGDFEPLRLTPLSLDSARHYAERLARARHGDDLEMREAVVSRFADASQQPNTARLMSSPLQVTIMTLLVERRTRMPQNRYELFEAYYTTIYNREVDKPGETGRLLAEHRGHIDWLHQFVGLTLQSRAARSRELDSVMPEQEVYERSRLRLVQETENEVLASRLAEHLFKAAAERLVLLVAPEADHIGFEVRSLQEFMAARALISGPEAEILPRLQSLAGSESWNNAWLLAAAGIFTHRPHLRDGLLTMLRAADGQDRASMVLRPGARLAADLVEDDLARAHPRHHRLLVAHATELLSGPPGPKLAHFAALLGQLSIQSAETRDIVDRAVGQALHARDARLITILLLLSYWADSGVATAPQAGERRQHGLDALDPPTRTLVTTTLGHRHLAAEPLLLVDPLSRRFRTGTVESLVEVLRPFLSKHCGREVDVPALDGLIVRHLHSGRFTVDALQGQLRAPADFTAPAGLQAAVAEAIDAMPLKSWILAMQLHYWLHDLAHLPGSEPEPPHVDGVS